MFRLRQRLPDTTDLRQVLLLALGGLRARKQGAGTIQSLKKSSEEQQQSVSSSGSCKLVGPDAQLLLLSRARPRLGSHVGTKQLPGAFHAVLRLLLFGLDLCTRCIIIAAAGPPLVALLGEPHPAAR